MPRPANSQLVAVAWLKTVPNLGAGMVATKLPKDTASWAASGFVVVGPVIGGSRHDSVPYTQHVLQVDCYATNPDTDNPPRDVAADLAEYVRLGTLDMSLLHKGLTLRAGYEQARVTGARMTGGPRELDDPGGYAWFQLDLAIDWIAV